MLSYAYAPKIPSISSTHSKIYGRKYVFLSRMMFFYLVTREQSVLKKQAENHSQA